MKAWLAAALLAVVLGAAGPAQAARRTLVVGVEDQDYRPAYGWHDGTFAGAGREILDAFAADRGYRLEYRPLPVKRLIAQLIHDEIDLKFPDNPGWAIDRKGGHRIFYSRPVIHYTDGTMVPAGKPVPAPDAIKVLATVSGFTPVGWQQRIAAGAVTVKETAHIDQAVGLALRGLADGAYVSVVAADRVMAELGRPHGLVFAASLPHANGSYSVSSAAHPELVAEFDAWLEANAARVEAIKARAGAEQDVEK